MKKLTAFGELMMRLSPPGKELLYRAPSLRVTFGGAEANVAVLNALFGDDAEFVTALPENDWGRTAVAELAACGVGTGNILFTEGRMGVYFTETGSNMRPSKVLYDRDGSAFACLKKDSIDWGKALSDCDWFHVTGITPALTETLCTQSLHAAEHCRAAGIRVSFDVNYRSKLWRWGRTAEEVIPMFLSRADVVFAGVDDHCRCLGYAQDEKKNKLPYAEQFVGMCDKMFDTYPGISCIASGLRRSENADRNEWGGILCLRGEAKPYISRTYAISDIVDRIGVGDCFAGALIYALRHSMKPQESVDFAAAASALKYTHYGDFMQEDLNSVQALVRGGDGGRVCR